MLRASILVVLSACSLDLDPLTDAPGPEDNPLQLTAAEGPWLHLDGDPANAADPSLDLSGWTVGGESPSTWRNMDDPPDGPVCWYRQTVRVSPDYPVGVVLWRAFGASELYVDGQKLVVNGAVEDRRNGRFVPLYAPVPLEASADGELEVAVRLWSDLHPAVDGYISTLSVGPVESARLAARSYRLRKWERASGIPRLFLGFAAISIALIHLLIFVRRREDALLAFGLGTLGVGGWYAVDAASGMGLLPFSWTWYRFNLALQILGWTGLYLFAHRFFRFPFWRVSTGVALVAVVAAFLQCTFLEHSAAPVRVATGLIAAVGLVGIARAVWKGIPNTRFVALGFALTSFYGLGNMINGVFGPWEAYSEVGPLLGVFAVGAVPVTIAIGLASRFSGTLDELDATYRASFRFVPVRFLEILGRKTITEVYRGDNTSLDMTVMFCDIRGFTTLSESRSPERNFRFINQFLETMEPAIHQHGGFVGQYLGDGFLALFPTEHSDPVRAAVAMQRSLEDFNAAQVAAGEAAVAVGIGLHSGMVMLGTIGGASRLDTGVVSDVVNTASRVEGLTKMYGSPLVISEATVERLAPEHPWAVQELDAVVVKGRKAPLRVFEVVDGEPDERVRAAKVAGARGYAAALTAFRAGDIAGARAGFAGLEEGVLSDLWSQPCSWLEQQGLPEDWSGVVHLTVK